MCFAASSTNLSETLLIILLFVVETMLFSQNSHASLVFLNGFQDDIFSWKIATLEPLLIKGYQTISPLVSNFIAESTNFKAEA